MQCVSANVSINAGDGGKISNAKNSNKIRKLRKNKI